MDKHIYKKKFQQNLDRVSIKKNPLFDDLLLVGGEIKFKKHSLI